MKYFNNAKTLDELKKEYRRLPRSITPTAVATKKP